jgi:hypothetical protein
MPRAACQALISGPTVSRNRRDKIAHGLQAANRANCFMSVQIKRVIENHDAIPCTQKAGFTA